MIKNYEDENVVTVIACQEGTAHSTTVVILKDKNEVTEAVRSTPLKAVRLTKNSRWGSSDLEKLLMT